jgi:hypothetical protein
LFRTRLTASGGGGGEKVLQREILAGAIIIATPYVSAAPVQVAAGLYLPLCLSYITAGGV